MKYFVEEVKVDTTAYDEVTIIIIRNNLMLCLVIMYVMCKYVHDIYILCILALSATNCVSA